VCVLLSEAALLQVLKSGKIGSVKARDDVQAELDVLGDRGLGTGALHRAILTQAQIVLNV
jgi:hypothetical protein